MSKSSNRHRHRVRRVKRRRASDQPPVRFGWKDRLLLIAVPLVGLLLVLGLSGLASLRAHRNKIESRVERWKTKYDLNESQVRELIDFELEFHRHEKPFSLRSEPAAPEKDEHRRELAKLLGAQDPDQIKEDSPK